MQANLKKCCGPVPDLGNCRGLISGFASFTADAASPASSGRRISFLHRTHQLNIHQPVPPARLARLIDEIQTLRDEVAVLKEAKRN